MSSSWTEHLINPHAIAGLYDEAPPLEKFELRELRLEQRGPSCFLRGDLATFPDEPRPSWDDDADRLEIRLSLSAIEDFSSRGEAAGDTVDLAIEAADDGFGVVITGRGDDFEFHVAGIALQVIGMKPQ